MGVECGECVGWGCRRDVGVGIWVGDEEGRRGFSKSRKRSRVCLKR